MSKRLFSLLLAILIMVSVFPMAALAAGELAFVGGEDEGNFLAQVGDLT